MTHSAESHRPTHAELAIPTPHIRQVDGPFNPESMRLKSLPLLGEYNLQYNGVPVNELMGVQDYEHIKKTAFEVITDSRTGLLNNRGLEMWMERYSPEHFGVIFCDGRDFGRFNKEYGHAVGNKVIQTIGEYFARSFRTSVGKEQSEEKRQDPASSDIAALNRFGGDEFIAVLNLDNVPTENREAVLKMAQARLTGFNLWIHGSEVRILDANEEAPKEGTVEFIELDSASMLGDKDDKRSVEEYRDLLDYQVGAMKRARKQTVQSPSFN